MSKEEFPHEKDLKDEVTPDKAPKKDPKAAPKEEVKENPVENYEKEIAELTAKNKDLEDKYLRSEAEIQNMQVRYAKERAQLIKYESQSLAKEVLPAMDNLERALAVKADDEAAKQLQKGVQMTLDSLVK